MTAKQIIFKSFKILNSDYRNFGMPLNILFLWLNNLDTFEHCANDMAYPYDSINMQIFENYMQKIVSTWWYVSLSIFIFNDHIHQNQILNVIRSHYFNANIEIESLNYLESVKNNCSHVRLGTKSLARFCIRLNYLVFFLNVN